jgi:hypothetical protein
MYLHLEIHWLIILMALAALLWLGSLAAVWFITRRRTLRHLLTLDIDDCELHPPEAASPEDEAALALIRECRRRHLLKWWPDTEFSFKVINELSLDLVRQVAQIYYPQERRPELKASLAALVALHNRVGARLAAWLETFPIRTLKDVELKTVLKAHELYQQVTTHPGYVFVKEHGLDRAAKWGWGLLNAANPWYWGRRAAYHGGKEVAARLLLAQITQLVGEEAMQVYRRGSNSVISNQ